MGFYGKLYYVWAKQKQKIGTRTEFMNSWQSAGFNIQVALRTPKLKFIRELHVHGCSQL